MYFSKYNIFSKLKNSDNYFIVNILTGHADILQSQEANMLKEFLETGKFNNKEFSDALLENKYFVNPKEEESLYKEKYLNFLDSRDNDEIQIFFVPNYSCNFSCSYCYQDQYSNSQIELNQEIVDSFFTYINTQFASRKKYITVFGGEPLLGSEKQKALIEYLLQKADSFNLDVCLVTNGYTLSEYVSLFREYPKIREIQVTLDGTASVHNARRFLKGGASTFEKIVSGIDNCLKAGITINLRMVLDKENIDNLPELASFAINKGWTKNNLFKTQIGRNYELHHCQSAAEKLFTRISLYEKLYDLLQKYPHIEEFYKPSFSIAKFLYENGSLPDPLFDSCPACKTEWAFDYTGKIYSCTATVGKANEELGTFYPKINLNQKLVAQWEERDVVSIPECKDCSVQLACGGGCGSVAKNKNGSICTSDCRPVKELLELGLAKYFN